MALFKLLIRSFIYYWKSHLSVIIGVAISTMVLTGTLFVGDSVQYSLEQSTQLRLGKTTYLFSGIDRFFRKELAEELSRSLETEVAPLLQLDGIASAQGGKYKLNNIQVFGIDERFALLSPGPEKMELPLPNEAFISENLAQRLQLTTGDQFLLRVDKASDIPKNAPFVSDEDSQVSIRLKVGKILQTTELGRFNLKTSQTAPFNIFLPLTFLSEKMEWSGKINRLLIGENTSINTSSIQNAIQEHWTTDDMALNVVSVNEGKEWEIRSQRVFIDSTIVRAAKQIDPHAEEILTYMVNNFSIGDQQTPYSFLSAGPFLDQKMESGNNIVVNSWIAEDLNASIGDSIEIAYYVIGPLRKLSEKRHRFIISDIVPITGIYAEKDLMPNLPGLSDAGNCRDWQAGVPVKLDEIRDKDEDYWKTYKGTPKAFISYELGKELWMNRFGDCTAIRLSSEGLAKEDIEAQLPQLLSPRNLGFSVKAVKEEGLKAARGGVDFSQLFMGLSFFLLVAGLILVAMLFNLHLEKRATEIGTFNALGYPHAYIRKMVLLEGFLVALPGIIAGGLLAILYNHLIFKALNTVWFDIVRTSVLQEVVRVNSLIAGMGITTLIVWVTIWYNVHNKLKLSATSLQRMIIDAPRKKANALLRIGYLSFGSIALSLLIYHTVIDVNLSTGIFFTAGTLLLISSLLFTALKIRKGSYQDSDELTFTSLVFKNLYRNRKRSLRIIILFSLGTFVIISTGLNRKDLHGDAGNRLSGTGGFLFYMETTLPILKDLNDPHHIEELNIKQGLNMVQLRKSEGDDASCLNLNRITAPRILGLPSSALHGRFSFAQSSAELDPVDPWNSLKHELPGGVIPAIADQTVIQWGLGKKVGDTLIYSDELGQEMKLKLIGGLANSIFQGNVLIDEVLFLKHFPSSSGTHIFLVEGDVALRDEIATSLQRTFRNEGLQIELTADRLAKFHEVENTYLSIFLLLGGLAMILGTIGLGVSLARNLLDRSREIGILRAIGYQKRSILRMITVEHIILLLIGTLSGAMTAFIATLPSLLSEFVEASWQSAALILLMILVNGFVWITLISKNSLRRNLLESLRTE